MSGLVRRCGLVIGYSFEHCRLPEGHKEPHSTTIPCENEADPRKHDFQGWVEFDDGRGGTTFCSQCGITSFIHAMRYGP